MNIKIFFMCDNHTFPKFGEWKDKHDLVTRAIDMLSKHGFYSTIFVTDGEGTMDALTLYGRGEYGAVDRVLLWADKVIDEINFSKMVA